MTEYHWWADPDLAPLGSMVGVCVGLGFAYLYMRWRDWL